MCRKEVGVWEILFAKILPAHKARPTGMREESYNTIREWKVCGREPPYTLNLPCMPINAFAWVGAIGGPPICAHPRLS